MSDDFVAEVTDRLIRYAAIDTQADETSATSPSSARQFTLLNLLVRELTAIGAAEVRLTDYGVVLATIPATAGHNAPVMGWLAHVDTAPGFAAEGVKPRVVPAWDGSAISFPYAPDLILTPEQSPYLAQSILLGLFPVVTVIPLVNPLPVPKKIAIFPAEILETTKS